MKLVVEVEGLTVESPSHFLVYDEETGEAYYKNDLGRHYSVMHGLDQFYRKLQDEYEAGRGVGRAWEED